MLQLLLGQRVMCLRTGTDPLIGLKGWKGRGDFVQDNIKMDPEEMEGVGARICLIWLRVGTCVGLL